MQELSRLTFSKGMQTDIDKSLRDGSSYIKAENYTFTSNDGGTTGSLENARGNELDSNITFATDHQIVGYCNIVDETIYFTTDGTVSNIYSYQDSILTLLYSDESATETLDFSLDPEYRITAVGRYEDINNRKVYWADGLHELRFMNVSDDYTGKNATAFSIVPTFTQGSVSIDSVKPGGALKAGVIQYAYSLFNLNGAETSISQTSRLIKLSQDSPSKYSDFAGSELDETVNKSVVVAIDDIDTTFDYIRLYSIFYDDITQIPVVSIVAEREVTSGSTTIIDSGTSTETITLEEFVTSGSRLFIPKALASKNNHLFAANIEEEYFDVDIDCRAYRYNSASATHPQTSRTYDFDNTLHYLEIVDGGTITYVDDTGSTVLTDLSEVPTNFDAIPLHIDRFETWSVTATDESLYKENFYQSDGTTVGGEGLNVSYEISVDTSYGVDEETMYAGYTQYNSAVDARNYVLSATSHERGEVYRYGVVFFDTKGRQSYVKWIGDILTTADSYYSATLNSTVPTDNATVYAKPLKIDFTIDISSLDADTISQIAGCRLVRADRKTQDKHSKAKGILTRAYNFTDTTFLANSTFGETSQANTNFPNNAGYFYSPDVNVGGLSEFSSEDKMEILVQYDSFDPLANGNNTLYPLSATYNNTDLVTYPDMHTISSITLIEPQEKDTGQIPVTGTYTSDQTSYTTETLYVFGRALDRDVDYHEVYNARSLFITTDTAFTENPTDLPIISYLASIVQDVFYSRYGGPSYDSRQNTEYVPASAYTPFTSTSVTVKSQGDSVISMFEQMIGLWDPAYEDGADNAEQTCVTIPMNSTIDYRFMFTKPGNYIKSTIYSPHNCGISEEQSKGISLWPTIYPDSLGDLYSYNSVYSVADYGKYPKFYPKPLLFDDDNNLGTTIVASEKKSNDETIDSWTKFLYNNTLEVDTAYGDINTLFTKDNKLFFWQDTSFGVVAVNERSLITDTEGAQLSLGTGTVLERYDYISTTVGNIDKYNVVANENMLFWTYSPRNMICGFDNQLRDLSTSLGNKKYMLDKGTISNPISAVDYVSDEVLFMLNDEVLVYDSLGGIFTGVYTYTPSWFILHYDGGFSSSLDSQTVYDHNSDAVNRGNYYGTDYESTIKHICSDAYDITKVFDNLCWTSTSIDSDSINQFDDTFSTLRIYNDYQNTDTQTINYVRKERKFATYVPRDIVNATQSSNVNIFDVSNLDATQTFKRRIRDKYIILDLVYDNSNGFVFNVPYIDIYYRKSAR